MALKLYNTLTRSLEEFSPIAAPKVTMYNCGPTVYNYVHVGNLRAYVFADILRRTLATHGYEVAQVVNITDVGHLVSDQDEGDDKIEVGARREGKSVEEIIALYSDAFYGDLARLDILPAMAYPRATHYIEEQKAMIETLAKKGYTYLTSDGIYFDTARFHQYADFAHLDVVGMKAGLRVDMGEKMNPTDFALWKFSPEDGKKREQEWDSPLHIPKKGFPGWHIECSAIVKTLLGDTIDIHTGGIDHIPVHHTNEIAQSMCANGVPLARFWLHTAFMNVNGEKISKSLGNGFRLSDLHERGVPPLAFRYWLLTAHYRTQVNFTWEALAGAQSAYNRLTNYVIEHDDASGTPSDEYRTKIMEALDDDLNTASAIALLWTLLKDESIEEKDKRATLLFVSSILGLGLEKITKR
jgi:cysteinyl-tRNA synthetase